MAAMRMAIAHTNETEIATYRTKCNVNFYNFLLYGET